MFDIIDKFFDDSDGFEALAILSLPFSLLAGLMLGVLAYCISPFLK